MCIRDSREIRRLILTCSGGPFYGMTYEEVGKMTKADALRHPNWTMGPKITVDCATLMNKGLEVIEAMRLYRCLLYTSPPRRSADQLPSRLADKQSGCVPCCPRLA